MQCPRQPFTVSPYLSSYLDLFRWLAAFTVVVGHIKHVFLVDRWAQLEASHQHTAMKAFFAIGDLGHQGVMIFFVLSGFLVGGAMLQKFITGAPLELGDYAVKRLSRLMLVLIPALGITVLFDWIGFQLLNVQSVYFAYQDFSEAKQFSTLVGNLFFLQEIFVPPYGSNISLWSLSYEFWYYVLFPALLVAFRPLSGARVRILSAVVVCVASYFLFPKILIYFGVWLIGAAIRVHASKGLPFPVKLYVAQFVLILFLTRLFLRSELQDTWVEVGWDYTVCLSFSLLLLKLKTTNHSPALPSRKWHSLLAESSYTLYLFHLPFLSLLASLFLKGGFISGRETQPTWPVLGLMLLSIILIYAFSLLAYYGFERHTKTVQERVLAFVHAKN